MMSGVTRTVQHDEAVLSFVAGRSDVHFNVTLHGLPYKTLSSGNGMDAISDAVAQAFTSSLDEVEVDATAFPGVGADDTVVQVAIHATDAAHGGAVNLDKELQKDVAVQVAKAANMLSDIIGGSIGKVTEIHLLEEAWAVQGSSAGEIKAGDKIDMVHNREWNKLVVQSAKDDQIVAAPLVDGEPDHSVAILLRLSDRTDSDSSDHHQNGSSGNHSSNHSSSHHQQGSASTTKSAAKRSTTTTTKASTTTKALRKTEKATAKATTSIVVATTTAQEAHSCPENYPVCLPDGNCVESACRNGLGADSHCGDTWKDAPDPAEPPGRHYNRIKGIDGKGTTCSEDSEFQADTTTEKPTTTAAQERTTLMSDFRTMERMVMLSHVSADKLLANSELEQLVTARVADAFAKVLSVKPAQVSAKVLPPSNSALRASKSARRDASGTASTDTTRIKTFVAALDGETVERLVAKADAMEQELNEQIAHSVESIEGVDAVSTGPILVASGDSPASGGERSDSVDAIPGMEGVPVADFRLGGGIPGLPPKGLPRAWTWPIIAGSSLLALCILVVACCLCLRPSEARDTPVSPGTAADSQARAMLVSPVAEVSKKELVQSVFQKYDVDRDGLLSEAELLAMAKHLEFPGSNDDFSQEFKAVCTEHSNTSSSGIDLATFEKMVTIGPPEENGWHCDEAQLRDLLKRPEAAQLFLVPEAPEDAERSPTLEPAPSGEPAGQDAAQPAEVVQDELTLSPAQPPVTSEPPARSEPPVNSELQAVAVDGASDEETAAMRRRAQALTPELERVFERINVAGDGAITEADLDFSGVEVPADLQDIMTNDKRRGLFLTLDKEGSGFVSKATFVDGILEIALLGAPMQTAAEDVPLASSNSRPPVESQQGVSRNDAIGAVFHKFDRDNDGILNKEELRVFASSLSDSPFEGTDEDWDELYEEIVGESAVNLNVFTSLVDNDSQDNPFYQSNEELAEIYEGQRTAD